ncbi:hypothetical protein J6590_039102 [Homalodisca vitripennis]|nr:hypothetical protein J6590_039102 [Homalodisca vitripennis]
MTTWSKVSVYTRCDDTCEGARLTPYMSGVYVNGDMNNAGCRGKVDSEVTRTVLHLTLVPGGLGKESGTRQCVRL